MGRNRYKDPADIRFDTFAVRLNSQERRMLVALANRLQRTQSDTVRLLVREAAQSLAQQTVESLADDCADDNPNTGRPQTQEAQGMVEQ